jgi:DUF1680 family protein
VIDAHLLAGQRQGPADRPGPGRLLGRRLAPLSDEQIQKVLSVEHGGILESYAELYAITGQDSRWLRTAERLRHQAVVEPLIARRDALNGLHANTQIPKIIGLARLYETAAKSGVSRRRRFFHQTVVDHHSYVLGGNSEREHFGPPDKLGGSLTTATCEACNTYNMLKLTRRLFTWRPDGALFDYYERAQLNHIWRTSAPTPASSSISCRCRPGPSATIPRRKQLLVLCRLGDGKPRQARRFDLLARSGDSLYVNLFIPSTLDLPGDAQAGDGDPLSRPRLRSAIRVDRRARPSTTLAIRRPAWAAGARIALNGQRISGDEGRRRLLARRSRDWRAGDTIAVTLPIVARRVPLKGAADTYAFMSGPLVLAADLGPAAAAFDGRRAGPSEPGRAHRRLEARRRLHHYSATSVLGKASLAAVLRHV